MAEDAGPGRSADRTVSPADGQSRIGRGRHHLHPELSTLLVLRASRDPDQPVPRHDSSAQGKSIGDGDIGGERVDYRAVLLQRQIDGPGGLGRVEPFAAE